MLTNINTEVFSNKEDFMYFYFLITVSEHSISLKIIFFVKNEYHHTHESNTKGKNEFENGKKYAFIDTDLTF